MAFWKLPYLLRVAVFSYTYPLLRYTHLSIQYEIFLSFEYFVESLKRSNHGQMTRPTNSPESITNGYSQGYLKVEAFLDIRLESWLDGSSSSILSIFAIFWTCWSEVISLWSTKGWFCWIIVVRGWIGVGLFEFGGLVGLWWILVPYNGFSGSRSGR